MKYPVVSWDAGTSFEKIVIGAGEENRFKFPSNVHEAEDASNESVGKVFNSRSMQISFEGVTYYVGDEAIDHGARGGQRDTGIAKYTEPSEIAKFLAGLAYLSNKADEIEIDLLMVDLSRVDLKDDNDKNIINIYKNTTFTYQILGETKKVKIKDVKVTPQGIGAYHDQVLNYDGRVTDSPLLDDRYALIDVGGRTSDGFIAKGIKIIDGTQFAIKEGMTKAFKKVSAELNVPWQLIEAAYVNNEELYYDRTYQYENLCDQQIRRLARIIKKEADSVWGEHLSRVKVIYLCGGGGLSTQNHFAKLFDTKKVEIVNDAQFANANGIYKLGRLILNKTSQEVLAIKEKEKEEG